jgi:hypothetical protein
MVCIFVSDLSSYYFFLASYYFLDLSPIWFHWLPLFLNPIFYPHVSSTTLKSLRFSGKIIALGSNTDDPKEPLFLDEMGVADDMDGYMNYLSLEYDSVWDTKPSW